MRRARRQTHAPIAPYRAEPARREAREDLDIPMTPSSPIPPDIARRIAAVHHQGADALRAAGVDKIEPEKVARAVESHRWALRPARVRLGLIAESHVYTSADDLNRRVRRDALPPQLGHLPDTFVRLVYCLAYGESSLLSPPLQGGNSGTRDYWQIFGRIAHTLVDGAWPQPLSCQLSVDDRLRWKLETLRALQQRGAWLLDASLHAIYLGRNQRVPARTAQSLHSLWWHGYGEPLLAAIR